MCRETVLQIPTTPQILSKKKGIAKIALAKFGDYDATYIDEMQRKHAEVDKVFNYSGENVNNAFFGWQQRRSDFVDLDVLPEMDDSIYFLIFLSF